MRAGWHGLRREDAVHGGSAWTILDAREAWIGGLPPGAHPELLLVRLYYKGGVDPNWVIDRVRYWTEKGVYVQIGNEPNHPIEGWGGGVAGYANLVGRVLDAVPGAKLLWVPVSPGFAGWGQWYEAPEAKAVIWRCAGLSVHAYGTAEEIKAVCWQVTGYRRPGQVLWLSEFNFGPAAGKVVDRDVWAKDDARPVLDWLKSQGLWVAATYFPADRWDNDTPQGTSPSPTGTSIVSVIEEWDRSNGGAGDGGTGQAAPGGAGGAGQPAPGAVQGEEQGGGLASEQQTAGPVGGAPAEPAGDRVTYTREQLVAMARAESAKNGFPEDVFEAQINLESNFDPAAVSPAGAKGIAQLMSVHFEGRFDPFDPAVALAYAAKWMGDLYRQFGRIDLALAAYNAGPGAVATYGNQIPPFQETRTYVRTILNAVLPDVLKGPSVAMAQFDPVLGGPSSALASLGYDKDTILSACGPIALEAMATVLNPSHPPTISDVLDAAPRFGWTRAGGMNGAANLVALAREFGVGLDEVRPAEVEGKLLAGQPVIVSTGIHFYFAQRHSRSDDDLFVGNTGLARKGGAEWMSLDRIAANDASYGGINGLFVGRLISEGSNVNDTTTAPAAEPVADGRVEALEKAADAFRGGEHAEQCLAIAVEHALYLYKDLAALKAAGKEAA